MTTRIERQDALVRWYDPYRKCEATRFCRHDTTRGVLVSDLLETDGPHTHLWVRPGSPAILAQPPA